MSNGIFFLLIIFISTLCFIFIPLFFMFSLDIIKNFKGAKAPDMEEAQNDELS